MPYTGGCLCGSITYEIDISSTESAPKAVLCHCTSCKRYTGSSFSANIIVPKASFRFTQGIPKLYLDSTDLGPKVRRQFCGNCGSPFTAEPNGMSDAIVIKMGTLDDKWREQVEGLAVEIYCKRRDRWMERITDPEVKRFREAS